MLLWREDEIYKSVKGIRTRLSGRLQLVAVFGLYQEHDWLVNKQLRAFNACCFALPST